MRDMILGRVPVFFTSMPLYVIVCITTALIVFFLAMIFKRQYIKHERFVAYINNFADAAGISAFAVTGVRASLIVCPEGGAFLAILMGMLTCIGGGMTRDLILRDIPFVLRKHIYALATLAGSGVYYVLSVHLLYGSELGEVMSQIAGVLVCFLIRVFATVFKWNMPRAITFSKMAEEKTDEENVHVAQH